MLIQSPIHNNLLQHGVFARQPLIRISYAQSQEKFTPRSMVDTGMCPRALGGLPTTFRNRICLPSHLFLIKWWCCAVSPHNRLHISENARNSIFSGSQLRPRCQPSASKEANAFWACIRKRFPIPAAQTGEVFQMMFSSEVSRGGKTCSVGLARESSGGQFRIHSSKPAPDTL